MTDGRFGRFRDDPIIYLRPGQFPWFCQRCPDGFLTRVESDSGTMWICTKGCGQRYWKWKP